MSGLLGLIPKKMYIVIVKILHFRLLTKLTVFQIFQVDESLNDMDFQLFLDLYFTDGDYT